jgi:hypothetical protein
VSPVVTGRAGAMRQDGPMADAGAGTSPLDAIRGAAAHQMTSGERSASALRAATAAPRRRLR